jgi:hypothetical protein
MRLLSGVDVHVPPGWQVAGRRQPAAAPGRRGQALVHAATVPLPHDRGDFGSGVVLGLGSDDVFLTLFEYDEDSLGTPLFEAQGLPRVRPSDFDPSSMQRVRPGMSGGQWFFTSGGSAWSLFAVLGSHARRQRGAVTVGQFLQGVRLG